MGHNLFWVCPISLLFLQPEPDLTLNKKEMTQDTISSVLSHPLKLIELNCHI